MRVFAIALILVLFGCGGTEPVSTTQTSNDPLYLSQIREDNPPLENISDNRLISLGHTICEAFDAGVSFAQVAQVTFDNGFTPESGGSLIGAAIGVYCPEHSDVVTP